MKTESKDEIDYVVLDGVATVIRTNHEAKRQKAWSLREGQWVEADVVDALHKGRVVSVGHSGMTPEEYFGVLPEIPEM